VEAGEPPHIKSRESRYIDACPARTISGYLKAIGIVVPGRAVDPQFL